MEDFNLKEALAGKPFRLKNGFDGVIKYSLEKNLIYKGKVKPFPYIGYIIDNQGYLMTASSAWDEDGNSELSDDYNALKMLEEPIQERLLRPFNVNEALKGKFVKLRNQQKALIYINILEQFKNIIDGNKTYPLRGAIFYSNDEVEHINKSWTLEGNFVKNDTNEYDIVCMWE